MSSQFAGELMRGFRMIGIIFVVLFLFAILIGCAEEGAVEPEEPGEIAELETIEPEVELPAEPQTSTGIIISGVITNLGEAGSYLDESAYLQLVSGRGQVSNTLEIYTEPGFTYIESGDITYALPNDPLGHVKSDLAETSLTADGTFSFQIDNLAPGSYFVVAQNFKTSSFSMGWGVENVMALARDGGNPESVIVLEIPDNPTLPFFLDMGEVVITLPSHNVYQYKEVDENN
jgi:hypothetical protein